MDPNRNKTIDKFHQLDLSTCEQEPIHLTQFVQDHGFLISIKCDDLQIAQVSVNIETQLNFKPSELISQKVTILECNGLEEVVQLGLRSQEFEQLNPTRVWMAKKGNSTKISFNLIIHRSDNLLILEFEPYEESDWSMPLTGLLNGTLLKLKSSQALNEMFEVMVQQIKRITQYDRVMLYRFAEDWHGEVVAEAKEAGMEPFKGLHYPASDIPIQARELYKKNLVRFVSNVNVNPSVIYPEVIPDKSTPTDLSLSVLRAVSPIHIEYLKNMGVSATLTISLLDGDNLWGLIACHHNSPKFLNYEFRNACKFLSQVFSLGLNTKREDDDTKKSINMQETGHLLFEKMAQSWDVVKGLTGDKPNISDLIDCCGVAIIIDDNQSILGETPSSAQIMKLVEWLQKNSKQDIFQTYKLSSLWQEAAEFNHVGAGILAIRINEKSREYIIWFRPEIITKVNWGGNPSKPVALSGNGEQKLSPRKSFQKWTEQIMGQADPWTRMEVKVATKLWEDINYILLQKSAEFRRLNAQLNRKNEELDAFSHTVSHDLRLPLTAIKSFGEILMVDHSQKLDEQMKLIVDRIIRSTDRMEVLIKNILSYSRISKGSMVLENIEIRKILDQAIEDLTLSDRTRNVRFSIGETPDLRGDQTMITQLFTNLLSNAHKYTRQEEEAEITINGKESSDKIEYQVRDNGIGIDLKYVDKIFEVFSRLHDDSFYEGSGIGLSIAKRIMDRHNGDIWVESEPGKFSCFYVSFPKTGSLK
ncbi:MAG: histidine kinase [Cyclobacteriaceae bacterium]|nr:MAG: histidine kinase [Cyclobacteriaceae bacterium]